MRIISSKKEDTFLLVGLAFVCGILLLSALYFTRLNSQELLRQEAEATAVGWSDHLGRQLENAGRIFATGELNQDNESLRRHLQDVADAFAYEFFSRDGTPILALSKRGHQKTRPGDRIADETAIAVIAQGKPHTVLVAGTGQDYPAAYSSSYVPFVIDGKVVGALKVLVDQTLRAVRIHERFTKLALVIAILMALGFTLAVAVILGKNRQRKKVEEQISFLAEHEPLSGLLNRRNFNEAMNGAMNAHRQAAGHSLAFFWLDIKGLRQINDNLSHAVGDQLIKEFGQRLRALAAGGDITGRLGGDEFGILRIGALRHEDIDGFAGMLARELNTVYDLGVHKVVSGAHIGVVFMGLNELSAEEIINCGESAKFHAKGNSHLDYCYFEKSMAAKIQARNTMVSNLRRATSEKHEFQVFYQPQFALHTGELRGFESLLRWHLPAHGIISPADFIPIAEDTGLICEIGDWVLNQACAEAVSWPRPYSVAVNVSAVQFRQDDLLSRVKAALERSGLDPARLELEITESALFQHTSQAITLIEDLKRLGVRVAMDDFGSGFSSLTHLWRIPFDNIKIDQTFIGNLNSNPKVDKIVTSIVELGNGLGFTITAEGVETAEQEAFLRNLNCKLVQGFRYGRPCPAEKIIFEDSVDIGIENLSKLARQVQERYSNASRSASKAGPSAAAKVK